MKATTEAVDLRAMVRDKVSSKNHPFPFPTRAPIGLLTGSYK